MFKFDFLCNEPILNDPLTSEQEFKLELLGLFSSPNYGDTHRNTKFENYIVYFPLWNA